MLQIRQCPRFSRVIWYNVITERGDFSTLCISFLFVHPAPGPPPETRLDDHEIGSSSGGIRPQQLIGHMGTFTSSGRFFFPACRFYNCSTSYILINYSVSYSFRNCFLVDRHGSGCMCQQTSGALSYRQGQNHAQTIYTLYYTSIRLSNTQLYIYISRC